MSEVKLSVGGREYAVACAEGEEAHVSLLGEQIDAKLQQLGANISTSESQNLLFGALFLADELHESRKAADAAQVSLSEQSDEFASTKREASLAVGQRDALKLTVTRLEEELDGLQSSQQRHAAEVDDIRAELQQRREEAENTNSEHEKLTAKAAEAERERDGMKVQIANKDLLLERANTLIQGKNSELEESKNSFASQLSAQAASTVTSTDPDLAPALERFADLLENCADKLESKAITS